MIKKINLKQTIHITHNISFANCTCKFQENYQHSSEISINEAMKGFKGRAEPRQPTGEIRNEVLGTV